jgi:hypothetical protein
MKTIEELKTYIQTHPGLTVPQIVSNLCRHGVRTGAVRQALLLLKDRTAANPVKPAVGQPISDLLAQYDDVAKVTNIMKSLDTQSYIEDDEMRRKCSVNIDRWRILINHNKIKHFRYKLPNGKSVWMQSKAQESLTRAISLDQGLITN